MRVTGHGSRVTGHDKGCSASRQSRPPLALALRRGQAARDLVHGVADPAQRRAGRTDPEALGPVPDDLTARLTGPSATVARVTYTFLFLAIFPQARLLPAPAEKASRACPHCGNSAPRADLKAFVKCTAQGARCTTFPAPRIASFGPRVARPVACLLTNVTCCLHRAWCRMRPVPRRMHRAPGLLRRGQWHLPPAIRGPHRAGRIVSPGTRTARSVP